MEVFRDQTTNLKFCKKESIKVARQLLYREEVIHKIRNASSTTEVYQIMHSARKEEI